MRVIALSVCCLLLAAPAAWADPVADLAQLTRASLTSQDPARIFYLGLAELGDVALDRAQVSQALAQAGVQSQATWASALTSIVGLKIEGDRVTILRDDEVLLSSPNGTMKLDPKVEFRLRVDGQDAVLSDMTGISVGKTKVAPYAVTGTRYTVEDGVPVGIARIRVGFFTQKFRIEMPPETIEGFTGAL